MCLDIPTYRHPICQALNEDWVTKEIVSSMSFGASGGRPCLFGPAQERVQKECGAAPFGAVQLVMEMQISSPQLGSARPNRPMDKKKTICFFCNLYKSLFHFSFGHIPIHTNFVKVTDFLWAGKTENQWPYSGQMLYLNNAPLSTTGTLASLTSYLFLGHILFNVTMLSFTMVDHLH